jgi:gluconate 2-dehydrogenase alpha chain
MGAVQTNGRPLQTTRTPKGTPQWGLEWKEAVAKNYLTSYEAVTHGGRCPSLALLRHAE